MNINNTYETMNFKTSVCLLFCVFSVLLCTDGPFQCRNSDNPNHRHETDCSKFYECTSDMMNARKPHMVLKSCAEGLMYDPTQMICDWPANVIAKRPECENRTGGVYSSCNENKSSHENNSFKICIVIAIILLVLAVSGCLVYRCHHKRKTNITSISTQTSNANNSQTWVNPAYDRSAGSNLLEDVAYEPCYDEICQVSANAGELSYTAIEFGKELYSKPTPKALRQNNKTAIYAQVLPKNERDNAGGNVNGANQNGDGGYYNMFENEPYVNSKMKAEYAEPCYTECSKN